MATLVFSAIGTMVGGPLGGAVGALIGRQVDQAVIGSPRRDGPRLRELSVTGSSYGSALPRHYGRIRAPGTIIWAADLVEKQETGGGGKGTPSTTVYSYSASFAVALCSRPIRRVERIWADGNLLRGAAGDLKTGGALRIYCGHRDQPVDPLIASDKGAACPAYRGTAYCVFESLELGEFGNRIPALTFEIVADDGEITLMDLLEGFEHPVESHRRLAGLKGFSAEGGPLVHDLSAIDQVYPLSCDSGGERLALRPGDAIPAEVPLLPEPAAADEESFGAATGQVRQRLAAAKEIPGGMRYYDTARDYQPGLQRADGRARTGRSRILEFPGALEAANARALINQAAERAGWSREVIGWRTAELDPELVPGKVVRVPSHEGLWRIEAWEWRSHGIEFELRRLPRGLARRPAADPGTAQGSRDVLVTPTQLAAYELPWDGSGSIDTRLLFAAPSSFSSGWTGAALFVERGGQLAPLGNSGARRSVLGRLLTPLAPSLALLLDRQASVDIELAADDFALGDASPELLANGANRALIGNEVVQFSHAVPTGDRSWRLSGLLRGRGGTEGAALAGHTVNTGFVLLDERPVQLDPGKVGFPNGAAIAALGLADDEPVNAAITNPGISTRPLSPVHPRVLDRKDGGLLLSWTRRARGAWGWPDEVEIPLNEQNETYIVGVGPLGAPWLRWDIDEPRLEITPSTLAGLSTDHSGAPLWVRQAGSFALSPALLLTTIP